MNFDLDADDLALQQGIRDLCAGRVNLREERIDRALWEAMADSGVFSITRPMDDGGLGLGLAQAVLVFEELGRALIPGPLVATFLAGVVPGRVIGMVDRDASTVEHLESLDQLVVLDSDGVWVVDPRGVSATPIEHPLDPFVPLHMIEELPQGELIEGPEPLSRWFQEGTVLTAAFSLGIASHVTELAVAYAKEREQFGRPIGSFQAVKHICADMLVRAEVARAAVYAAGVLLDDDGGAADRAVHAAKLLATEASIADGKACIQVHGGMGFTWETDPHLYLKRAMVLATHFGEADRHAEAMADHL